jgi:hypothetical protein
MDKVKVVLYCQSCHGNDSDGVYGENRMIHHELQKKAGCDIEYRAFGGHLKADNLESFLNEARTANVVLLDAWTHAENFKSCQEAWTEMAMIARRIQGLNPEAVIFAELMEGCKKVAVHRVAGVDAFADWSDEAVIEAIKWQNQKQQNKEGRTRNEDPSR